ncbi:MAG TPA: hypothetical protein VMH39_10315 [Gemmatimonadaceae bacterium]|nr:hypothetical protein [Gemmatimonadaceae bacterium]
MRRISRRQALALIALAAATACRGDKKLAIPEDSLGAMIKDDGVHRVETPPLPPGRDPNLGAPPSWLPDSFAGVIPGAASVLKTATDDKLGTYMVDSVGRPIYMSDADKGGNSLCHDNCGLTFRPVFAPARPVATVTPVQKSMISSFERDDWPASHRQLRYNGMPLYYYAGDAGGLPPHAQAHFEFGAHWYVVSPDGKGLGWKPPINYLGTTPGG